MRYRPRNQVPKLLEGSGRFADISEVIFIVILITIDDPIRENDEMSTPIEGTVTQSGRVDRSAQVLGITRMRTIVSPPTVYVREADPTCDDQTEKGEDPVHGSDDSRDMSRSGIANVARTLLFRLFQDLSNTNSRKFLRFSGTAPGKVAPAGQSCRSRLRPAIPSGGQSPLLQKTERSTTNCRCAPRKGIATLPGGWDLAHAIRLGIKPFAELGANSEALSGSQVDSPCSCRAIFESAPVAMLQSRIVRIKTQRADKELKAPPPLRGSAMVARPTRPQIFAVN